MSKWNQSKALDTGCRCGSDDPRSARYRNGHLPWCLPRLNSQHKFTPSSDYRNMRAEELLDQRDELLAALKSIKATVGDFDRSLASRVTESYEQAKAAIAKAEDK